MKSDALRLSHLKAIIHREVVDMKLWTRLALGMTPIVGGVWLAASFGLASLPPSNSQVFWTAFLILWGISLVMDWRSRKDLPHQEPSPARSAVTGIVATGAVAVLMTAQNAQSASEFILPASIMPVTALLAVVAFRFASKNKDHIGEARFDTTSNKR